MCVCWLLHFIFHNKIEIPKIKLPKNNNTQHTLDDVVYLCYTCHCFGWYFFHILFITIITFRCCVLFIKSEIFHILHCGSCVCNFLGALLCLLRLLIFFSCVVFFFLNHDTYKHLNNTVLHTVKIKSGE